MDEKGRISLLEREIELLKQVIELREQARKYVPAPYYPVYPQYPQYLPQPWPNYQTSSVGAAC